MAGWSLLVLVLILFELAASNRRQARDAERQWQQTQQLLELMGQIRASLMILELRANADAAQFEEPADG